LVHFSTAASGIGARRSLAVAQQTTTPKRLHQRRVEPTAETILR